ncbi:hypothetical protein [Pseudomonas putida]|uniref:Uncharacterized protein n=1 Tax=Pseudomonas putida TaxID=303 RepID=A0A8I1ECX3_PSEPU|nr:hypothetical protein [Pseudomonas putida]MBI6882963.1 hypothetical protein [Pseudomonas putida]
MRDTFYVGFDPDLKVWDVARITHSFAQNVWVFRVIARSEDEALSKGLTKYMDFMAPPSDQLQKLFQHIRRQVGRISRTMSESMIIEIPSSLLSEAEAAAGRGYFTMAGTDEVILDTSSVGWKAIEMACPLRPRPIEYPSVLAY